MKKRIISVLLLCCMVLTLLPTTAFAADELPDVKLSIPTTFDKTVYLTNQKKELKITDSKTYLIKGSADPNWYFQYRIKIDGGRKKITPHIFLDGVRLQAPKDGPAIELYGGASACLYFIGNDSELIGAENFAALQKNKTDGYLRVLVQTGTKLTCEGGRYGAGIGGSKVGIKKFSQGHGMNLHFGSLATDIYGGEILATSGVYGAGIGGGQGGVGEQIYVYSGKLMVRSVSEGAGIGGGQGGPGRFIYIKGGTVNAGSESGGAGIGSGDQDGQNKSEDAHHIEISGGTVEAWSNYAGAGIGGGRNGSGRDISITGGVVRAQGYFGAGIGGGMNGNSGNILIKDTTLTALALPLYSSPDYTALSASAVGRGSNRVHYQVVMQDQEFAMSIEENIKIGASNGKSVWLSATGWQWRHNQEPKKYWYWDTTTELLIPNENGRVDLQRLSLPYAYNYGRVISELELRCEESTCSHEFGWAIRDDCHIWACMKCGARDPAAEMSKQNGKHIPGDWSNQKQLCTVCDHVLERDTKAPVMETLTDGESYIVEDNIDGNPGAYTFTVSDPAASGETSSGIKSVTINGEPQDGPTYRLPAPDGGNNDAGAEYTVVATDNAGNETTATVRIYRRHHYTVTFDSTGGSEVIEKTMAVTYGERLGDMPVPMRTGYFFRGWYDAPVEGKCYGNSDGKGTSRYDKTENCTLYAQWKINQYTITFDTAGGSVVTPITQNYGTAITAPAAPTKTGYTFTGWDRAIPATMPAENLTITAQWTVNQYTIAYDLAGGTAEGNPDTYTIETRTFTLKNPTKSGYTFTGWSGTGLDGENNMTVTIPTGSTGNRTYTAHWRYNGSGHSYSYYTIKATAGAGGSISPSGNVSVREGRDQTFTITPDKGYAVANVKIDGKSIGAVKSYTFENVRRTHTIEVIFMKANGNPQTGVFVDVATGSYYEDAVDWAVENGITKGTDDTHFSPDGICTRAQAVTFLWRTAGSPASKTHAMPFTDVPVGSYYYDAVLWAVENGITKGTSDTTFSPNMTCTRAQIVAFLWRSEKSPAAGTANPFADVKSTAYYADAVLWAVKENITKGTTNTTFSPDADCTRAQIVTFLWRCKK